MKEERFRIGIIYTYSEHWIGGTYYTLNLIHALNRLEDAHKPHLEVVSNTREEYEQVVAHTQYPYLSYVPNTVHYNIPERVVNRIGKLLTGKNDVLKKQVKLPRLLFPVTDDQYYNSARKKVFWIADFQERFLPEYFSAEDIEKRAAYQHTVAYRKEYVILSSHDARNSFLKFFPDARVQQFVLPFAVTHQPFEHLDAQGLLQKYGIDRPFFFSPNQFWIHKNHKLVLQALKRLKEEQKEVLMVFSGKEHDYRHPEHFNSLKAYVQEQGLEHQVRFLGFIDRAEQLKLMSLSRAVVQPSKFEGWSTVVEDAKAMGKLVLASDIPVHKEQLPENGAFFGTDDVQALAGLLNYYSGVEPMPQANNYDEDVKRFGASFLKIAKAVALS